MKNWMKSLLAFVARISLKLRYRVKIVGLEELKKQSWNKDRGFLFLPNHPAIFVDPALVGLAILKQQPVRPVIIEYMYYMPFIHFIMRALNAIPIPGFSNSSNSHKRRRSEKALEEIVEGLKANESYLFYPAGRIKSSSIEHIGSNSGLNTILSQVPDANLILVRTKGLWGSSFSRALTHKTPDMNKVLWDGFKDTLCNLIFFNPRREITIEFERMPNDFPVHGQRLAQNRYLESWYNKPDHLNRDNPNAPGDTLVLVPRSLWNNKLPEVETTTLNEDFTIDLNTIAAPIKEKIYAKLAELSGFSVDKIKPHMSLNTDLGLDSLDTAEVASYVEEHFDIKEVVPEQMSQVSQVLAIASKQIECETGLEQKDPGNKWFKNVPKGEKAHLPKGNTIPEVFLNCASINAHSICCSDPRTPVLTYGHFKLRVLLLAEMIRQLPGDTIGILLPASVAATACILACQLVGKTPLMLNWTVGSRHLTSVVASSKIEVALSSWAFVDKLASVDLNGVDEHLLLLEDVVHKLTWKDKLKAFFLSKCPTKMLLRYFNTPTDPEKTAVLLFTSGSEGMPKGVPLTHTNILSNIRAIYDAVDIHTDDVFYAILPPFHSFGFTVCGFAGLLGGLRTYFYPNPTDGQALARGIAQWKVTIFCGAPAFLKNTFRYATKEQLSSLRLCVTGAEKAPADLFATGEALGLKGKIIEGYGITECSPVLTVTYVGEERKGVGRPLPGVSILIVHPDTHEALPVNTQGLILANGPNVFSGYFNTPVVPFVTLQNKCWYITGDLGFLDEKGRLTISGRQKRFIKVGAEMVSLGAIEEALTSHAKEKNWGNPENGAILAISAKEIVGERPKILLFTTFPTTVEAVNQILKEEGFSNLIRITHVYELPGIPVLGTGKTNYRELESEFLSKL